MISPTKNLSFYPVERRYNMYAAAYVWAKVLASLEQKLSAVTVSAWFDDVEVISLTESELILYSPSDFRREIIRKKGTACIEEALRELFDLSARLTVWDDRQLRDARQQRERPARTHFNAQFTLDNFIPGTSNRLALQLARAVAENPGQGPCNPLFLYGPPGVGKTHLLHAIAGRVTQLYPQAAVVYIRGDQFTNEMIEAIQSGRNRDFRKKYREADVFLIDDIHFIAGKESTQEEFFHTFNELYEHRCQIVMTADRSPSHMATLEDRLLGRFSGGVLHEIVFPDYETRLEIIHAKAKALDLPLEEEVAQYIARSISGSVRLLEGILNKLQATRMLSDLEPSLTVTEQAVSSLAPKTIADITPGEILSAVCHRFGVDREVLKSRQKTRNVAAARQTAIYLTRTLTDLSMPEIAALFHRDHTTILYAIRKVDTQKQQDQTLAQTLRELTEQLESNRRA